MSMLGTYESDDKRFKLNVTQSQDSNGTFSGTFEATDGPNGLVTIPVSGRYRFRDAHYAPTNISFSGLNAGGENSNAAAWAGDSNATTPDEMKLAGCNSYVYGDAIAVNPYETTMFYRI